MGGTITNQSDVGRKWPTTALAPRVLTELEGAFMEKITGPAALAAVELSHPVEQLMHIFSYVTATGAWSAVTPNPVEGTNFSVTPSNANGKGELTELNGDNYAAETWFVLYRRPEAEGTIGGQHAV